MAIIDAGSRVHLSSDISTDTSLRLPDCSKDVSNACFNYSAVPHARAHIETVAQPHGES